MTGKQSNLTPYTVLDRLRRGFSYAEIGQEFGVTRQYVSKLAKQLGDARLTPRQIALRHFPWTTPARFNGATPNRLVRDHLVYVATQGKEMPQWKLQRLSSFYRRLREGEGVVVEFDPDIPPGDATSTGGFAYRTRLGSDGGLIIRVNKYTTLTNEGRELLKLPPTLPSVRKETT